MSRLLAVLVATIAAFGAFAGPAHGAVPKKRVQHLQHAAVSDCGKGRGKLVRQNVVVRRGRVHHLGRGKPFLSHDTGSCRPIPKMRPASAIVGGQRGCDLSNNDPTYQGFYAIRKAGLTYCWLKNIEGVGFHDRTAAAMRFWADKAGVIVGGYDFGHVCLVSPVGEAHFFAVELKADGLTGSNRLRPAGDFEYGGCSTWDGTRAWIAAWIGQMHREGFPDLTIYTGCWWWNPHTGGWWPAPEVSAWISGYPFARPCGHAITVHQDTDAYHVFGIGFGFDGNVLLGSPSEITGGVVVPPDIAGYNARIKTLWSRRPHLHIYGRRDLDYQLNRIYQLGWSPHLDAPRHDWTGPQAVPSQWAKDDCAKVVARWKKGRHGNYVFRLVKHMWDAESDRCHAWGVGGSALVVRFPGNVVPPGAPTGNVAPPR